MDIFLTFFAATVGMASGIIFTLTMIYWIEQLIDRYNERKWKK